MHFIIIILSDVMSGEFNNMDLFCSQDTSSIVPQISNAKPQIQFIFEPSLSTLDTQEFRESVSYSGHQPLDQLDFQPALGNSNENLQLTKFIKEPKQRKQGPPKRRNQRRTNQGIEKKKISKPKIQVDNRPTSEKMQVPQFINWFGRRFKKNLTGWISIAGPQELEVIKSILNYWGAKKRRGDPYPIESEKKLESELQLMDPTILQEFNINLENSFNTEIYSEIIEASKARDKSKKWYENNRGQLREKIIKIVEFVQYMNNN